MREASEMPSGLLRVISYLSAIYIRLWQRPGDPQDYSLWQNGETITKSPQDYQYNGQKNKPGTKRILRTSPVTPEDGLYPDPRSRRLVRPY